MIEPVDPRNPTPGSLLRHQRQHIGWTVDEVANALCLSTELINALESGDYDHMGGSTFILGYLRSYARLVGTDIEDAIVSHRDSIPEYVPDVENLPSGKTRGKGAKKKRRKKSARKARRHGVVAIAVLVVAVCAGAGVFFLWPPGIPNTPRVTEGLTVESAESPAGNEPAPVAPPRRLDRLSALDPAAVRASLDADREVPFNLTLGDIAVGADASAGAASATPAPPAAADDTARHLVLLFDEGSWADVRDSNGNRLLSQTVSSGSSVDLIGEPPFTVFLGNAGGVRVQYMGRIQTYSQSKKGLFARFTVGQER